MPAILCHSTLAWDSKHSRCPVSVMYCPSQQPCEIWAAVHMAESRTSRADKLVAVVSPDRNVPWNVKPTISGLENVFLMKSVLSVLPCACLSLSSVTGVA